MKPPREKFSEPKGKAASRPDLRHRSARVSQPPLEMDTAEMAEHSVEEALERMDVKVAESSTVDDEMEFRFGSREETNAALEEKIAAQNTLKLHDRL